MSTNSFEEEILKLSEERGYILGTYQITAKKLSNIYYTFVHDLVQKEIKKIGYQYHTVEPFDHPLHMGKSGCGYNPRMDLPTQEDIDSDLRFQHLVDYGRKSPYLWRWNYKSFGRAHFKSDVHFLNFVKQREKAQKLEDAQCQYLVYDWYNGIQKINLHSSIFHEDIHLSCDYNKRIKLPIDYDMDQDILIGYEETTISDIHSEIMLKTKRQNIQKQEGIGVNFVTGSRR